MTYKMTNFRAEDMPGAKKISFTEGTKPDGKGEGSKPPKQPEPQSTGAINDGTAEEVKDRVGDDLDAIQAAIEAEYAEEDPRSSLIEDLESRQRRLEAEQEAQQGQEAPQQPAQQGEPQA